MFVQRLRIDCVLSILYTYAVFAMSVPRLSSKAYLRMMEPSDNKEICVKRCVLNHILMVLLSSFTEALRYLMII